MRISTRIWLVALAIVVAAVAISSLWNDSATADEPAHLAAGRQLRRRGGRYAATHVFPSAVRRHARPDLLAGPIFRQQRAARARVGLVHRVGEHGVHHRAFFGVRLSEAAPEGLENRSKGWIVPSFHAGLEMEKVVQDDLNRSAYYSSNAQRSAGRQGDGRELPPPHLPEEEEETE